MASRTGRFAARALLIWAAWTLYALFAAGQNYLSLAYGARVDWRPALKYALLGSYIWAALTPLVFLIAGRLLVRRANWWWTVPLLLTDSVVFSALDLFVFLRLLPVIGYRTTPAAIRNVLQTGFHSGLLTCWALFGIRHTMEYYRRYQARELKASQLEAKLALAQLEVLKMQLQPHFLFNTLHAISALMYRNVESADRMIARLSDFLRLALDSAGVQEVTLQREMEYLDKYLEIEQVRFGERLEVCRRIEPDTLDLMVPNLVLQPLVENAVRHGIAPRAAGGRIEVTARAGQGTLTVEVLDDGPGVTGEIREGLGLSNTRARLQQLYGADCRLELGNAPEGGFRARLILPAHSEPIHANPDRG